MSPIERTRIQSPLPQRYLTADAAIGGRIKMRPDDFIVDEIPAYEPSGAGHHLYLRVEKRGVSHGELLSCIRRHFNVRQDAIGYAGMKDKHAVTRQTISIPARADMPSADIHHERIDVLWAKRHRNKIKRGHLRGNRFFVRIREVDPAGVAAVQRVLDRLGETGVPCFFGSQRFGYRANNHLLGAYVLNEDWLAAVTELLGTSGTPFPEYQRERRELFDQGRCAEAARQWSPADRTELIAIKSLAKGDSPREAILAIGKITVNFFTSSLMSAAFNAVLDRRIDEGTVGRLVDGDIAWKHDSRATFPITAEMVASGELPPRLKRLEISPSGPLWGVGYAAPAGRVADAEREALLATGVDEQTLTGSRYCPQGGRRPFRAPISNVNVESGADEHGPYIGVAFDLPRGCYATIALREIMKNNAIDRQEDARLV